LAGAESYSVVVPQCFGLGCSAGDRGGAEFGGSVRAHFPVALVTSIQRTVPGTLPQHASATLGRALRHRPCGLGACVHKRTLHTRKRALYIHKRDLHESCCSTGSSTTYPQKSPTYPQKSPTYPQKSPAYPPKSPAYLKKSPKYLQKSPTHPQKSLTYPQNSHVYPQKSPTGKSALHPQRALHIRKRALM